uniref:Uncharacterized protein n=1 Tax=Brassica oleracea var. oleracea TaxID=109376 RepID=A0A0D3CFA3_BRAOL
MHSIIRLHHSSEKQRDFIACSRKGHSTLSKALERSILIAMCSREHLLLELSACRSSYATRMLAEISLSSTNAACVSVITSGKTHFKRLLRSFDIIL